MASAVGGVQRRTAAASQAINGHYNTIQIALSDTSASAELTRIAIGRSTRSQARDTQTAARRIQASTAQTQSRLQRLAATFQSVAQRAVGAMRRMEERARRTSTSVGSLGNAFRRAFAFVGVSAATFGFVRLADQADQVANRLRILSTDTDNLNAQMQALFDIARETRAPFEAVSEVFARFRFNTQNLGFSQQRLLDVTRTISQAIALSGANAIEASTALVQLSQGMASTELRGQELRSVLEQLPVVADLIAMGLDVTRGQLLDIAEDGLITADAIIEGVEEGADAINRQFAQLVPTIGQSFSVLQTRIAEYIYSSNQAIGQNAFLANSIIAIADNVHVLIPALLTLATAVIVRTLIPAISALYTTILANPIVAIISAIAGAVVLFLTYADDIRVSSDGLATVWDVLVATGETLASTLERAADAFGSIRESIFGIHPALSAIAELLPTVNELLTGYFAFTGNAGALEVLERAEERAREREELAERIQQLDTERNEVGRNRQQTVPAAVRAQIQLARQRRIAAETDPTQREFLSRFLPIQESAGFQNLSGSQQLGVRLDIETTASLERQNTLYDQIRGNVNAYRIALVDAEQVLLRYPEVSRAALDGLLEGFREAAFPVQAYIQDLDEQIRLASLSADAREAETAVINAQNMTLEGLQGTQEEEIRSKIAAIQAAQRQRQVYETIRSPVEQTEEALADLAAVQARYGDSLDPARVAFWRREIEESANPLETYIRQLAEGTDLLALDSRERAIANAIKVAERSLNIVLVEGSEAYNRVKAETIRRLNAEEAARLRGNLSYGEILAQLQQETFLLGFSNEERRIQTQLIDLEQQARDGLNASQRLEVEGILRANAARQRQNRLVEALVDPLSQVQDELADLNAIYEQGRISQEQYNEALVGVRFQLLALSDAPVDRFRAALISLSDLGSRVAVDMANAFTQAFRQASDELARYIVESEDDFDRVIQDLLASLLSIQIQEQFVAPLAQGLGNFFDRRRGAPEETLAQVAPDTTGLDTAAVLTEVATSGTAASASLGEIAATGATAGSGLAEVTSSGLLTARSFNEATSSGILTAQAFQQTSSSGLLTAQAFNQVTSSSILTIESFVALSSAAVTAASALLDLAIGSGIGSVTAADGGLVVGPGGPRSDSIFARLSNGEFVVNARSTRRHIGLLTRINSQGFQNGGLVGGTNVASSLGIRQVNYIDQRRVSADEPPPDVDVDLRGDTLEIVVKDKVGDMIARGEFDRPMGQRYGSQRQLRT